MEEQSLASAFGDSLSENVSDLLGNFLEIGLDSVMDDGLMKEIPFVSTAVSLYHIGKTVHERHHVQKQIAFVSAINAGAEDEEKRKRYRKKFASNEKFRNQELEFILILIDRYIGFDKPQMLAKLYLAYLDKKIAWTEFTMYTEVIDRFLPGDVECLTGQPIISGFGGLKDDRIMRLMACGLLYSKSVNLNEALRWGDGDAWDSYALTDFGEKLASILK